MSKINNDLEAFSEAARTSFKSSISDKAIWSPETYGFKAHQINDSLTREDIYYLGDFELRRLPHDYWLCRKKVKNKKGNIEYLVRFYTRILPNEIHFAALLLTKGLR